jgi:hypothetical protein
MECKNCQQTLQPSHAYCFQCGGMVVKNRITFKSLFSELLDRYFSLDSKLVQTWKALFTKPEDVVNGYINGVRNKYMPPLSFFILAIAVSGFYTFLLKKGLLGDYQSMMQSFQNSEDQFNMNEMMNQIMDYQNLLFFAFLPFMALISKILFYNQSNWNFAEHTIVYAYTYAQCNFLILLAIPVLWIFPDGLIVYTYLSVPLYILLHAYFLKRIFQLTLQQIIVKTLLFIPLLLFFYMIIVILVAIVVLAIHFGMKS